MIVSNKREKKSKNNTRGFVKVDIRLLIGKEELVNTKAMYIVGDEMDEEGYCKLF